MFVIAGVTGNTGQAAAQALLDPGGCGISRRVGRSAR